jgi:hypothetical protein
MPKLTTYLLLLSTDANELANYRTAKKAGTLVSYLTDPGGPARLTTSQAQALDNASNDTKTVSQNVIAELKAESSRPTQPFYGLAIHFACEVNHIQTGTTPPVRRKRRQSGRKKAK